MADSDATNRSVHDGKWGREIKAQAEAARRIREQQPTPRPWRWLPDEGQFIVTDNYYIVAEIPCQGSNPVDGAFIVEAANAYDKLRADNSELLEALRASAVFAHGRGRYCAGSFDYCTKRECIAARKVIRKAEGHV